MRSLFRRGIHFLLIALAAFVLSIQASADTVNLGTDYLQTLPGTFFNFTLPGLGTVPVPFMGNAIGPGNTDTIVERLANATVTPGGAGDTIPIKLVALSLQSTSPVDVGGTFFNVFVTLDPTKLSKNTGFMTILENAPGTGGTFSSIFTVFFQAKFVPVGGGTGFSVFSSLVLQNGVPGSGVGAAWISTFPPGFVQVTGPCGDQDANVHTGCPAGHLDFFPILIKEKHPSGAGRHVVRPACSLTEPCPPIVPEPATLTLFATGMGMTGLLGLRRRRRN